MVLALVLSAAAGVIALVLGGGDSGASEGAGDPGAEDPGSGFAASLGPNGEIPLDELPTAGELVASDLRASGTRPLDATEREPFEDLLAGAGTPWDTMTLAGTSTQTTSLVDDDGASVGELTIVSGAYGAPDGLGFAFYVTRAPVTMGFTSSQEDGAAVVDVDGLRVHAVGPDDWGLALQAVAGADGGCRVDVFAFPADRPAPVWPEGYAGVLERAAVPALVAAGC